MTIDFHCSSCAQTLKAPLGSEGKKAKCPKCGQISTIPASPAADTAASIGGMDFSSPTPDPPASYTSPAGGGFAYGNQPPKQADVYSNPYASPAGIAPTPSLVAPGEINPSTVDPSSAFSHAWDAWKENVGMLVLAAIVAQVVMQIGVYGIMFGGAIVAQIMGEQGLPILIGLGIVFALIFLFATIFFWIGQHLMILDAVRGKTVEFGTLFKGGPYVLPLIGVGLLLSLIYVIPVSVLVAGAIMEQPAMLLVGFLLLFVIMIVFIFIWPFAFLLIDDRATVGNVLGRAFSLGKRNVGPAILLWFFNIAIIICGYLACFVGVIVAVPLAQLLWAAAYLQMIGEVKR